MSYPSAPGPGQPFGRPGDGRGASGFPGRTPEARGPLPPQSPARPSPPPPRGPVGPPRGQRGGPSRSSGGSSRTLRLDPVVVESVVGLVWLAVGTIGLGADGVGTLLLAFGIAAVAYVLVQNRRQGPGVFDAARSGQLLRLGAGTIAAVVVASILLGIIGFADYLPGLAAMLTGGAFVLLAGTTGQKPTTWLGIALVVLGLISAFASTQEANPETGGFVSQGLLGLVAGVLVIASAADRVGLLSMLRDRIR